MKTAIVTGSNGNLGRAVVLKFISSGYRVVGTVTHKDENLKYSPGNLFEEIVVDVSKEEEAAQFIAGVISKHGSIDVAVLTVGGFAEGTIVNTKASGIAKQYKLNFETAYNIAQPVFSQMIEQNGGRIFLIGSRAGADAKSSKGVVAYGLAKSLLFRLSELMNDEGSKHNVVTSVVVPNTIDTAVNRKFMPDADFSTWVKPEVIADVIYFYCTDAAAAIKEPVIKVYNNA